MNNAFSIPILYRFYQSGEAPVQIQITNFGESFQLFFKERRGSLIQFTKNPRGHLIGGVTSDGSKALVYIDQEGEEQGHIFSIDVKSKKKKKITKDLDPFTTFQIHPAKYNADVVVCWFEREKQTGIIKIENVVSGEPRAREIYKTSNNLHFPIVSPSGAIIACIEEKENCNEIVMIDQSGQIKRIVDEQKAIELKTFVGDDKIFIVEEGEAKIFSVKEWEVKHILKNFKSTYSYIDCDEDILLIAETQKAHVILGIYDLKEQIFLRIGDPELHYDYFEGGGYLLKDKVYIRAQSGNLPPEIHEISLPNKKIKRSKVAKVQVPKVEVQELYIQQGKEEFLQGWLHMPLRKHFNRKIIIDLHGGPHSCVFNEFNSETNYFVGEGFGVFHINYHGSTTFGKKYESSIIGQPGIQEARDCVTAKKWLVGNNYANSADIYLLGWSWGGFVALLAAGRYPNEFKKIACVMGIGNNEMAFEDEHMYLQEFDKQLYGGTPQEKPEVFSRSNPLEYAKEVCSEVFLIHGKSDKHCPPRQMENYYNELRKHAQYVRIHWTDYGHLEMFSSQTVREENAEKLLGFFYR